jgi:Fur family ferric uptake transcriptional regulator
LFPALAGNFIVYELKMTAMSGADVKDTVRKIFSDYLEEHGQRKTPERFAILEEVYSINDHFDVESLYARLKAKKHQVSRATVYNTIELLQECELVTRHQFGKNLALYEKSYAYKQHDHLICQDCEHVFEFCDPRIQQIQAMMGQLLSFDISHHSLNLYGHCNTLKKTGSCQHLIKKTA